MKPISCAWQPVLARSILDEDERFFLDGPRLDSAFQNGIGNSCLWVVVPPFCEAGRTFAEAWRTSSGGGFQL